MEKNMVRRNTLCEEIDKLDKFRCKSFRWKENVNTSNI